MWLRRKVQMQIEIWSIMMPDRILFRTPEMSRKPGISSLPLKLLSDTKRNIIKMLNLLGGWADFKGYSRTIEEAGILLRQSNQMEWFFPGKLALSATRGIQDLEYRDKLQCPLSVQERHQRTGGVAYAREGHPL